MVPEAFLPFDWEIFGLQDWSYIFVSCTRSAISESEERTLRWRGVKFSEVYKYCETLVTINHINY